MKSLKKIDLALLFNISIQFLFPYHLNGKIILFDNFDYGLPDYHFEEERAIKDSLKLQSDDKSSLPSSFTICSSFYSKFLTSYRFFFQIWTKNRKPWFNLGISTARDYVSFTERIVIMHHGLQQLETLGNVTVPIAPMSLYHGCFGVDTVTGHVSAVVNGVIAIDKVINAFRNSSDMRPKSLAGKLTLFNSYFSGFFYQSRQSLTNLNVHSRRLSSKEMISLTKGTDCNVAGDYLAWNDTVWEVQGRVNKILLDDKELCSKQEF